MTISSKVSFHGFECTNISLTLYPVGCLYRHHLPTDDEALDFLGIRDVPRWFRDKYDVPSVLRFGNNSRIMFRAYVNAVYKKLADKEAASKKEAAAKKAREQAGQSETTTTATADASNSLTVPASAIGGGQLVTRGHHGRHSKSPRGGNGGGALHGRGRGGHGNGHHYRTVQPAQHIHHNGQGTQLAITAPPRAPTPSIVPSNQGGSTFAEVAAGTSKQASPVTSSNSGSENSSDTVATVGAPGCITLNITPKENGLGSQSSTHMALHNSVMNGNDDAKLLHNETRNLDVFGLPNVTKSNEDFRKSSRRLFESYSFGTDGADDGADPMWEISDGCMDVFGLPVCSKNFVSTAIVVSSEALQTDSSSAASILNSLVAESEPLENKVALANWGPIREAVKHPQPAITEPIITNGKGLTEVNLILDETEGAPRPGKHSAIDIANFCNRVANVHARDGNGDLAAEWNDLAHRAHAKAIFAWRLKVNNEFGGYVNFGPDIYTIWRQKRGTADYPYATGSRSLDIDQGFCVPVQAPENAALGVWLAHHRSLILDSAAQEFAT